MKYEVIFTPIAEENIETVKEWLEMNAPARALKWVESLIQHINTLDEMPNRFPYAKSEYFPNDVRFMVYNPYRIYYRVEEDKVYILHIRHTALPPI